MTPTMCVFRDARHEAVALPATSVAEPMEAS